MSLKSFLFTFRLLKKPDENFWNNLDTIIHKELPDIDQYHMIDINKTKDKNESIHLYNSIEKPIHLTIRYYNENDGNFISINGEMSESCGSSIFLRQNFIEKIKKSLNTFVNSYNDNKDDTIDCIESIPLIKRNNLIPEYFITSDGRVLEYDFDKILVNETTRYQNIKILHSPTLGNCLLLDDMQNLAESDLSYTHGLMNFGKNNYKDKEILILGGGDGGLLHELLKESPKFVTMIDIDEKVMLYCRKYLRGACGDTLDNFDGINYKIIVDDCINYLQNYNENKIEFDYIFNDLTDIPIHLDTENNDNDDDDENKMWSFITDILKLSMKILRPNGFYLNHAVGINCKKSLNKYENLLMELSKTMAINITISSHTKYVPSFMEDWVFYQIQKH